MSYPTGNKAHDVAILAAEAARQVANASATTPAQVNAAHVTYYKAVIASCIANNGGAGQEPHLRALQELAAAGGNNPT